MIETSKTNLISSLKDSGFEIQEKPSYLLVECEARYVYAYLEDLKVKFGFLYLRDTFFYLYEAGKREYHFLLENFQERTFLKVVTRCCLEELPELSSLWEGVLLRQEKTERRVDEYGLTPIPKHPLPVVRDYKVERMNWRRFKPWSRDLPYGFELFLELLDEEVVDLKVEDGFCHRGLESQLKGQHFLNGASFLERLNYQSSVFGETLWYEAFESYSGLELPDRAKALRMVFLELSRIDEHFKTFVKIFKRQGFKVETLRCQRVGELIQEVLSKVSQKKTFHQLCTLGGLRRDIPLGWKQDCHYTIHEIEKVYLEIKDYFYRNPLWLSRFECGAISPYQAIDLCLSGPNLRACGLHYDLRKYRPSLFYEDVDFEVPLGVNGDSYNRFIIRNEEVFQSLSIISQVIDNLPVGDICLLEKEEVFQQKIKDGWIHHQIESPTGALGVNILVENNLIECLSIRSPSYSTLHSLREIVGERSSIKDVLSIISTLNIVDSEVDK